MDPTDKRGQLTSHSIVAFTSFGGRGIGLTKRTIRALTILVDVGLSKTESWTGRTASVDFILHTDHIQKVDFEDSANIDAGSPSKIRNGRTEA